MVACHRLSLPIKGDLGVAIAPTTPAATTSALPLPAALPPRAAVATAARSRRPTSLLHPSPSLLGE